MDCRPTDATQGCVRYGVADSIARRPAGGLQLLTLMQPNKHKLSQSVDPDISLYTQLINRDSATDFAHSATVIFQDDTLYRFDNFYFLSLSGRFSPNPLK